MAKWLAEHRVVTRVVLVVVDVVVLVLAITGLDSSGRHWTAFVVLLAWLGITVNFGWVVPKQVDDWRRRREEETA